MVSLFLTSIKYIKLKKMIQRQERRERKEMEEASLRKFMIVPASIFV